jgi:hypothetical protein
MIGRCHCERPTGHPGQHAITEEGRTYRWGSRSGTVEESQRHTARLPLRVAPVVAVALDGLAASWGCTRSEAVSRLILTQTGGSGGR